MADSWEIATTSRNNLQGSNYESNTRLSNLLVNFHQNSLDFMRQLQRWVGTIDWWRWWPIMCLLARGYCSVNDPMRVTAEIWGPALSKTSGHQIKTEDVVILDLEERCVPEREKVLKPFLNKRRGLRFQSIRCQLTLDQSSSPSINIPNLSLQLPDEVQWVWMKIC